MPTKVYKSGAFLILENTVSGVREELNAEFAQIVKTNSNVDLYDVQYKGVSRLKVNLADIQDENGDPYLEVDFDTFRFGQLGVETTVSTGGSDYTETIVNISSAQILDMGTTPIELLPPAGTGKYYDIDKIFVEYTQNTTDYILGDVSFLLISNSNGGMFIAADQLITGGYDYVMSKWSPISTDGTIPALLGLNTNGSIMLMTLDANGYNANPTDGDGTLRVKIYHKTITFGA